VSSTWLPLLREDVSCKASILGRGNHIVYASSHAAFAERAILVMSDADLACR